jgi:hypothetical protein
MRSIRADTHTIPSTHSHTHTHKHTDLCLTQTDTETETEMEAQTQTHPTHAQPSQRDRRTTCTSPMMLSPPGASKSMNSFTSRYPLATAARTIANPFFTRHTLRRPSG